MELIISLSSCDEKIKFNIDTNFTVQKIEIENCRSFNFRINDNLIELEEGILIPENAEVKISKVRRFNLEKIVVFKIYGVEKDFVYDERKNNEELLINQKQINEIREISYE